MQKTITRTFDPGLLRDQQMTEGPFPEDALEQLRALLSFYLDKTYEEMRPDALRWNFHAYKIAKELHRHVYDPEQTSLYNGRVTPWMRGFRSMYHVFERQLIRIIDRDYAEQKDLDIIELFFRFRRTNAGQRGEGTGDFPYCWTGLETVCSRLKDKLCDQIIEKVEKSTKISVMQKHKWFLRLAAHYNPSSKRYKLLKSRVPKKMHSLMGFVENQHLFVWDSHTKEWVLC